MQNVVDRRIKCDGVDHTEHSFTKVSCAYRGSGQWLVKMALQPISPITAEYTISNFVLSTRNQRSRALQCGGFDAGFLRVRRGKALRRAYAVGTHKRFGKVVVL